LNALPSLFSESASRDSFCGAGGGGGFKSPQIMTQTILSNHQSLLFQSMLASHSATVCKYHW